MREQPPVKKKDPNKVKNSEKPIEEKESYRWLTALSAAEARVSERIQLVQVADREADIFELFARPRQANSELLIRIKTNRRVKHELGRLFPTMSQAPVLGELSVEIDRTPQRPARTARVQVRAMLLTIEVADYVAQQKPHLKPLELNALWVEETSVPADGGKPISWKLLTSLPIEHFEQTAQAVR